MISAGHRPTAVRQFVGTTRKHTQVPGYDDGGRLASMAVRFEGETTDTPMVEAITYDAKGQRTQIDYGNGVSTVYTYEPDTFRLATLVTTRPTPNPSDGEPTLLQDLRYTYDPVGNVIDILDASNDTLVGPPTVEPRCTYVYDALYRLTSATGREHDDLGGTSAPGPELPDWATSAHLNDWQAIHKYREIYGYDDVGNLESVEHRIGEVTMWTRQALHATTSNRLRKSWTGGTEPTNDQYTYDAHGNMTAMPHLSAMDWSAEDHLAHVDLGGGGDVDFLYDASGERLRKRYDHSGLVEERVYLGALEVYRKWDGGNLVKTTTSVHVMDGTRRVALVEYESTNDRRVRYPLGNHLGSACIEVDDDAKVISEEEYLPYGATAYRRHWGEVPEKRYRYTGKERDEETGLQYHSARYYAPWLGRWTAADPAGFVDGTCLYAYCRGNPVGFVDREGRWRDVPQEDEPEVRAAKSAAAGALIGMLGRVAKAAYDFAKPRVKDLVHVARQAVAVATSPVEEGFRVAWSAVKGVGQAIGVASAIVTLAIAEPALAKRMMGDEARRYVEPITARLDKGDVAGAAVTVGLMATEAVLAVVGLGKLAKHVRGPAAAELAADKARGIRALPPTVSPAGGTVGSLLGEAKAVASEGLPALRQQYVDAVHGLGERAAAMRRAGASPEEIARALHAERNALKTQFRGMSPADAVKRFEQRNTERYGDPLGPSIDQLRSSGKTWEQIIESATRPGGKDLGF